MSRYEFFHLIFEAIDRIKKEVVEFLDKEYRTLLEIWMFLQAMLGLSLSNDQSRIIWLILVAVSFLILIVTTKMVKTISEIRKPVKRFTKRNKEGDVIVEEERLHQALIYLSILEDQLEQS